MFKPRPYQQAAIDAALHHITKSTDSCVINAATGAGKSIIVAEIAKAIHEKSNGKRILCLAPSKELTEQNHSKYRSYGYPASIYSGSISKCLKNPVVFGTPKTVANSLQYFDSRYCMVVIDECHRIDPTTQSIVSHLKEQNPRLRVVGLTATPYRLGMGYIYENGIDSVIKEDQTKDPYFKKLIFEIGANELIAQDFLTKPVVGLHDIHYDTSELKIVRNKIDSKQEATLFNNNRLTGKIMSEVHEIATRQDRKGVMVFAATIQHAQECFDSLPESQTRLITGKTKPKEREQIINDFKSQKFKYLVNVSVLTTGFDAPHVDLVAILRATESASLFQQIVGRGLRLADNKKDCLILDYAENIEAFELHDNLFEPSIRVRGTNPCNEIIEACCPECGYHNEFTAKDNDGFQVNEYGFFIGTDGSTPMVDPETMQPWAAHHGRRCFGLVDKIRGTRCSFRWNYKLCPFCDGQNDPSARHCEHCEKELIDPNEKLTHKASTVISEWPKVLDVRWWKIQEQMSRNNKRMARITFGTDHKPIVVFFTLEGFYKPESERILNKWGVDIDDLEKHVDRPHKVKFDKQNGYFKAYLCEANQQDNLENQANEQTQAHSNTPSKLPLFSGLGKNLKAS
jgi:DNA repair protein RadD